MQVAAEMSTDVMVWDVRLLDRERDEAGNVDDVLAHLAAGMVLLGHDAGHRTRRVGLAAVPEIIRRAKERGFRFVTASAMLALDETARPS
jgi:peptidoglycan/xylan/chitin deacetylase (PgdA/CDA1 family)